MHSDPVENAMGHRTYRVLCAGKHVRHCFAALNVVDNKTIPQYISLAIMHEGFICRSVRATNALSQSLPV